MDNGVALSVGAKEPALVTQYEVNRAYPGAVPAGMKSLGPRIALGGEGVRARFRGIRISRDLYYTERGEYGIEGPFALGPDEFFLLGDNSADSLDGRDWGPVRRGELLGRPLAVVWPPARWRWLSRRGTAPPIR